jgi:hypothetical protein
MAIGRISGPLLKANLLRDGVDLAFETDLLYLDVVNGRVGVKTSTPGYALTINGTTRTTNLETTTQANIASFTIATNTISSTSSTINLVPSGTNAVVYQARILVGSLDIGSNSILTTGTNTNLEIIPSGTGIVNVNSNLAVYGNIHATGNISADGNIGLGNDSGDTISFTGEVNSDIIPSTSNTYTLGNSSLYWNTLYSTAASITTINSTNINVVDFKTNSLEITQNTISTLAANTNIKFNTTGTGGVLLGNLKFLNNVITNTVAGAITEFVETGTGYVKISGTYGVVIPSGDVSTRPPEANSEIGMIRFNTETLYVEVFNGLQWTTSAGAGGINFSDATDIGMTSALIFG